MVQMEHSQPINPTITIIEELQARYEGMGSFKGYVKYVRSNYIWSNFTNTLCDEIDKFIASVLAGNRPILILNAPPRHGKSEIASRLLPAYLMGRFPNWSIVGASYVQTVADKLARDVKMFIKSEAHNRLFPYDKNIPRTFSLVDRVNNFSSPNTSDGKGGYYCCGIGGPLTSLGWDIGVIDDPTKDAQDALSETKRERANDWYESVFLTRRTPISGQLVIATCWGELDIVNTIAEKYKDYPHLTHLRFPAINLPDESGYNPSLPEGALVPERYSLEMMQETKKIITATHGTYWWDAMYQAAPTPRGGAIFKKDYVQYYRPYDLPNRLHNITHSWDMTFKRSKNSDWVVGQVWCKVGQANYLICQFREKVGFTDSAKAVKTLWKKYPRGKVLIEEAANGNAIKEAVQKFIPHVKMIPPKDFGDKAARAHAVTPVWESGNVFLPHPDDQPWVKEFVRRVLIFDGSEGGVDDEIDAMTQALRELNPYLGGFIWEESSVKGLYDALIAQKLGVN